MTKKEKKPVVIKGIITGAYYGVNKYSEGAEKLTVTIEFDDNQRDKLADICGEEGIFKDADAEYIPDWFKKLDGDHINFKSNYDVPVQYLSNGHIARSSVEDMLADMGSITGSHCAASLTLKKGAVYLRALAIDDLKVQDFGEMFGDDNPFAE